MYMLNIKEKRESKLLKSRFTSRTFVIAILFNYNNVVLSTLLFYVLKTSLYNVVTMGVAFREKE